MLPWLFIKCQKGRLELQAFQALLFIRERKGSDRNGAKIRRFWDAFGTQTRRVSISFHACHSERMRPRREKSKLDSWRGSGARAANLPQLAKTSFAGGVRFFDSVSLRSTAEGIVVRKSGHNAHGETRNTSP